MKFCEGCQHRVADDVDVCPYCGFQYRQPKGRKSRRTSRDHEKNSVRVRGGNAQRTLYPALSSAESAEEKEIKKRLAYCAVFAHCSNDRSGRCADCYDNEPQKTENL